MSNSSPQVLLLMGSISDFEVMQEALDILDHFHVPYEVHVSSAHRSPGRTAKLCREAEGRGIQVIIAGAGSAAHLAGLAAAESVLPVLGVPIDSSPLLGLDALLATVQMPAGIPVGTLAVGKSGGRNAGILAVQIMATANPELRAGLYAFKEQLAREVEEKDRALAERISSRTSSQ